MTNDQARHIVESTSENAPKDLRGRRSTWIALGVLLFCIVAAVVYFVPRLSEIRGQLGEVATQSNQNAVDAAKLRDQVLRLGGTPVVEPAAPTAPAPAPAPAPVPVATGPTQAQIDDAVAEQLRAHPPANGQDATPAMVATAVADYLTVNPPTPGRPPTADEISAAASSYIASHAADFRGTPGHNGNDGQSATDAQVAASVAAYCDAHGNCAGGTGAQGVSVTDVEFQRDDAGTCQVVVSLHNPATGDDTTATHPAGDAACPAAPTTSAPILPIPPN
ncbi:MAG: hypothetical protein JWQ81_1666 [Amycolatopsis sp.]|uniref:hypothetical protein n=1 Tax=Amycolatopsis sp. TaxID=37632 RepID=UPI002633E286|nr:hypothetical protein [Amycolatopsis sp.]MCU1680927.1 hypothetical protein [Amycolatopsis sp.]